jgi:hypothetical protein
VFPDTRIPLLLSPHVRVSLVSTVLCLAVNLDSCPPASESVGAITRRGEGIEIRLSASFYF